MKRFHVATLAAGLALALAGCGTLPNYETVPAATLANMIKIEGDALDGYRTADSSKVRPLGYSDGLVHSFVYARATKMDGGKTFVGIIFRTRTKAWLDPTSLNFGSPLRSIPAQREGVRVECYGDCSHEEVTYFEIPPDDVRWLIGASAPEVIELRLKARADTDRTIRKDELRATLDAVGLLGEFE